MAAPWNWKSKDGGTGGLLYESGNWGDLIKMLWLKSVMEWKSRFVNNVNYFDPFAGDVCYPLGKRTLHRISQCGMPEFDFLREAFLDRGFWPSAASGARLATAGRVEVWDADSGRRENWAGEAKIALLDGESGWRLLEQHITDPDAVWMIDPYDFLAEWRDHLQLVADKSRATTLLLYIYNRSARDDKDFREYRACKNALEDLRGDLPKRIGRAAGDVFLPRSHHEMWFLPSEADCAGPGLDSLSGRLADTAFRLENAMRRCGVCDA